MYAELRDRVEFLIVYVREAHASDGWQMPSNVEDDVVYRTPANLDERADLARTCVRKLGLEIPALVDDFQNSVDRAYMGWPDRLYVVGRDGRIAYKSAPGPFGFEPERMREALVASMAATGDG
jgi:type I thyroxine 5'-deiodinase